MSFQVRGVNHQDISRLVLRLGQFFEDALKHTVCRPTLEPVVERLVRPVISGRIDPLQPVFNNVDNPAQDLAVIDAVNPTGLWKERCNLFNLLLSKPK